MPDSSQLGRLSQLLHRLVVHQELQGRRAIARGRVERRLLESDDRGLCAMGVGASVHTVTGLAISGVLGVLQDFSKKAVHVQRFAR